MCEIMFTYPQQDIDIVLLPELLPCACIFIILNDVKRVQIIGELSWSFRCALLAQGTKEFPVFCIQDVVRDAQ